MRSSNSLAWITGSLYFSHQDICTLAVRQHFFEMLKWAHENGCPLSYETYAMAVFRNQLNMIEWLKERGCPTEGNEEEFRRKRKRRII